MPTSITKTPIDIDAHLHDLSTFEGRLRYFFWITDPRLCRVKENVYDEAKINRDLYKKDPEKSGLTEVQIYETKRLYEAAFHPDTGDKLNKYGRMYFQCPGGMIITGIMLSFYKSTTAVVFWQWVNQSFNALVNYSNRNANSPLSETQLGVAYVSATATACFTAVKCKQFLKKSAPPIFQRYVPFTAVAAANCVNIPLMRQNEITKGVDLFDENGNKVGTSKLAAAKGISQVIASRIIMCAPGMTIFPLIMETVCMKSPWLQRNIWCHGSIQILGVGCFLSFMVPLACAIWPQMSPIKLTTLKKLEPASYDKIVKNFPENPPSILYYNKGL